MNVHDFRPPLSDKLLSEYDFFDLYPFDGGGHFIHEKIIGALGNREIFEKIIEQDALRDFGHLPEIAFNRFERWRSIEKSCWINRCYFLVPLAVECRRRRSEEVCRLLVDTMLFFIRNFPPPSGRDEIIRHAGKVMHNMNVNYNGKSYEEYSRDETDVEYIWFDFQPASRLMHFVYAMYFLKDFRCISDNEWRELENAVKTHADIIAIQENAAPLVPVDNHQSLRGLALLFAAAFFRSEQFSGKYLEAGLRICNYHIENDYFDDGALKEISPSYHSFETWHIRDALLLSKIYGFAIASGSDVLKKAAAYIKTLTQPDMLLPVVNDGYALFTDGILASLGDFMDDGAANIEGPRYFSDAGIAVYKSEKQYLLLDFSAFTGTFSHYHSGKNSFSYWYDGKAFFVDSGCCDYDDQLFAGWYKMAKAHSSVLAGNCGDGELKGTYEWIRHAAPKCGGWKKTKNGGCRISSSLASNAAAWKDILWERSFEVDGENGILVSDIFDAPGGTEFTLVFNLHPDVALRIQKDNRVELSNGGQSITMKFDSPQSLKIEQGPGRVFAGFSHVENKRVLVHLISSVGGRSRVTTEIRNV